MGRARDKNGNIVGQYDDNPLLNTLSYNVEFPDGEVREYGANVIAENMYSQVDPDECRYQLLDDIIDHRKNSDAVEPEDRYIKTKRGKRRMRNTTAGWDLLVKYKDNSTQWIPLRILKHSNPLEVAEYAISRNIVTQPAFAWWVSLTIRRRNKIIAAINSRAKRITHIYGIQVPRAIEEALRIDKENNEQHWRKAIDKEMENLKVAFDILPEGSKPPPGYTLASGHLVFDIRMTMVRRARWVKDGHKTPEPDLCTYAGVVSRETVRIAFTYAALNGLPICAADVQNAYLQALSYEKHYIVCGPEFGLESVGRIALIIRALYGGKSAGADYWRHVRTTVQELGFTSCKADPDV